MTRTHHASHDSSTREVCLILFKRHVDSCFQYKSDMKHKGNNTMTLQYTTSVKVSHHHVYSHTLCFIRSCTNISPTVRSDLRGRPHVNFPSQENVCPIPPRYPRVHRYSGVCCLWETCMHSESIIHDRFIEESRAYFAFLIKCTPLHNHPLQS